MGVFLNKIKLLLNFVFLFVIVFFAVNFVLYFILCISGKTRLFEYPIFYRTNIDEMSYVSNIDFKPPFGSEYDGKAYIIFGCGYVSYDDNDNQKPKKSIDYYLAHIVKRKVYNRAISGGGLQQALMQVQNHVLDDIIQDSEHVIFFLPARNDAIRLRVYPGPLIDNNYLFSKDIYPRYVETRDGILKLYRSPLPMIEGSIIYRIVEKIWNTFILTKRFQSFNCYEKNLDLIKLHIKTLNVELKKINPNVKLTILLYFDETNIFEKIADELSEDGIKILSAKEFDGFDVDKFPDPTEELWMTLAPLLAEKLN